MVEYCVSFANERLWNWIPLVNNLHNVLHLLVKSIIFLSYWVFCNNFQFKIWRHKFVFPLITLHDQDLKEHMNIQERSHQTVQIDDVTDLSPVLACACKRSNLFIAALSTKRWNFITCYRKQVKVVWKPYSNICSFYNFFFFFATIGWQSFQRKKLVQNAASIDWFVCSLYPQWAGTNLKEIFAK